VIGGGMAGGGADGTVGGAGSAHSYLPDSAMELIAEYAGGLRVPAGPSVGTAADEEEGETGGATDGSGVRGVAGDDTSGSHTVLPGFHSLAAGGAVPRPAGADSRSRGARWRRLVPGPRANAGRRASHRRLLPWAGGLIAAVALVAAGTAIGLSLRGSAQAADPGPATTGPVPCVTPGGSGPTLVCVSQPYGDGDTVFVFHGSGFVPGTLVTVSLSGHGAAPYQPRADTQGTFSYAIDQGGYFFHGQPIPPGTYTAVATGANGRHGSAWFTVQGPPPPPPSPPQGPPPGQPTYAP
jgi:hypothetical protein